MSASSEMRHHTEGVVIGYAISKAQCRVGWRTVSSQDQNSSIVFV